ncbi:MAG TPA: DUF362 domain-containing protein [Clostridiaceae bacterium]|nr:DUF362 domain-containing protein [Clostridiaceae bacterium]
MNKNALAVIYGNTPKKMVLEILNYLNIEDNIKSKNSLIGIKPNLVVSKPSTSGATTSPEIVAGIIEYLNCKGFYNLTILEGSWVGDRTSRAFKECGYVDLSKHYNVPLIDLQRDSYRQYKIDGICINICDKAMELDYLINVPVLKGHCQTYLTCALKNLKGCIPDSEKRRFHSMGLHKPIACLNKILKQDLIIVDGIMGDLSFEEGGNPVQMNRIIVAKDPVLVDSYAADLIGINIDDIPYIKLAEALGVGSADLAKAEIIEINKDSVTERISSARKIQKLAKYINEDSACSACYGSLIHALARLDEQGGLSLLKDKLYIGQGYKGKTFKGIGIGNCAKGGDIYVKGCPPSAGDILKVIQ